MLVTCADLEPTSFDGATLSQISVDPLEQHCDDNHCSYIVVAAPKLLGLHEYRLLFQLLQPILRQPGSLPSVPTPSDPAIQMPCRPGDPIPTAGVRSLDLAFFRTGAYYA